MNIEINDYDWAGESMTVQYFLDNEEHYLDVEHSELLRHVEEHELNAGGVGDTTDETGEHVQNDLKDEDSEIWLEDRSNQKIALESYLKHLHKTKTY